MSDKQRRRPTTAPSFHPFVMDPNKPWFDGIINYIDNGGLPPSWRGAHVYMDDHFLRACKLAEIENVDLFKMFSEHGEPGLDDKWMWEMISQTGSGVALIYIVHPKNVLRFDQFLLTVMISPDGEIPPRCATVMPLIAMIRPDADDSEPAWCVSVARSAHQERFKIIDGEVIQPNDSRWVDYAIKWPGRITRQPE